LSVLPIPKQGELPLLSIEAHQRADYLLLYSDLIRGIAGIKLPTLHPSWVTLPPKGKLSLGFGNLRTEGNHRDIAPLWCIEKNKILLVKV